MSQPDAAVATKPSTGIPYWIKVVAVFFLGWLFMYADRTILNPVMGNLQAEFGLSKADLGLINSVFFFAYAAMQIPSGMLGDKIGKKLILVPGFILFGVFTGISGLATTFAVFLIARALVGVGEGTYYGPQYALSSEAVPTKYRTLGTAIINSGQAFGTAIGLIAASIITLEWNMSWRTPFYFFLIPTIIVGFLIWWIVKEEPKKKAEDSAENAAPARKVKLSELFKNRNLVVTYITVFCSLYGFFMILTWLPFYLQTERGMQGSEVGFISSLVAWASIPGALVISRISDKLGKRKILALMLIPCAILSIVLTVYIQNYTVLILSLIFYGLTGKLALDPILVSIVADNAPKEGYGTAFSLFNFIGMCSSIIAPYITGYLADITGSMAAGFYLAALLLGVGFITMLFAKENKVPQA
ncbi:MFS transporter [Brevibacillus borstelensis]|uniref:MFS transporter n=1 Tax=Brevibacillus borstelensis TaxID=45462 RepID=UPI0030BE283A